MTFDVSPGVYDRLIDFMTGKSYRVSSNNSGGSGIPDIPWPDDISLMVFEQSFAVGGQENQPESFTFSASGDSVFVTGISSDRIHRYSLPSPFSLSGAQFDASSSIITTFTDPIAIQFNDTGDEAFVLDSSGVGIVRTLHLASPYDIENITQGSVVNLNNHTTLYSTFKEFVITNNGSQVIFAGQGPSRFVSYNMDVPYDFASIDQNSVKIFDITEDVYPRGMDISRNGDYMYMVGSQRDTVFQYELSTPFDIDTISFTGKKKLISSQTTAPTSVKFSGIGDKCFILGRNGDFIFQYAVNE